jgi:hypothetical protein
MALRSPMLNNIHKDRFCDQNLIFSAPPYFGKYVKSLVPPAFAVVSTHSIPKNGWHQGGSRL